MLLYETALAEPSPEEWGKDLGVALSNSSRDKFRNRVRNDLVIEAFNTGIFDIRRLSKIKEFLKDSTNKTNMIKFLSFGITSESQFFFRGLRTDLEEATLKDGSNLELKNIKASSKAYISAIRDVSLLIEEITTQAAEAGGTSLYTRLKDGLSNEITPEILSKYDEVYQTKEKEALQHKILTESTLDKLEESLISLFKDDTFDTFMNECAMYTEEYVLNEGIVGDSKDKARNVSQKYKRAGEWLDNIVNRKIKKIKDSDKKAKQDYIIKGSLSISRELNRGLKTLPLNLIHPGLGYLIYLASILFSVKSTNKQRTEMIAELKTAEKVVDELIDKASRDDDTKGKIKLIKEKDRIIRSREKLLRHM